MDSGSMVCLCVLGQTCKAIMLVAILAVVVRKWALLCLLVLRARSAVAIQSVILMDKGSMVCLCVLGQTCKAIILVAIMLVA